MKMRTLLFEKLKLILLFIIACFALNTQTAKGQEPQVITFKWLGDTSPKSISIAATSGKPFTIDWGNETRTDTIGKGTSNFTITQPTAYGSTTNEYTVTVTAGEGCVFTYLSVADKQIVLLDVSKAPSLTILKCNCSSLLTTLDVSNNTALTNFQCDSNPLLTTLDISNNTKLMVLTCHNNSLTSLKISPDAPYTTNFWCYNNKIPLSDLKALPSNAQIGVQTLPEQTVERDQAIMVDDAFYGAGTNFAITLDGSAAVENTHYTTADGKITFKYGGKYVVTMKNNTLGVQTGNYVAQIKTTFNVVKSTDATLKTITVSQETLTVSPTQTEYTVNVPYSTESITINATANDSNETVKVTGTGAKTLKPGNNDFNIEVTAEDGTTKKTYKVTVNRTDVTLKNLTISPATLTFDPNKTDYNVDVPFSIKSITINATKNNTNASIDADAVGLKNLIVGDNIFELVVKAQDGSTRTYKVTVTRNEKSTDATLSKLELSQGKLVPDFNPAVTDYTVKVDNSATSISFGTMFGDSTSTVTITKIKIADTASKQAPANELRSTAAKAMPLDPGVNYFVIAVTAEDGKSTLLYIITVIRGAPLGLSSDTRLSNLWLSGGATLTPDFKPYVKNYNVTVGTDTEEIQINAIASDFKATIEGTGVKRLAAGENRFNLKVTAEDKTQDIYTITITREGSPVGLEEITRDPIQVYPNPVQDYFRVKGITEPATVSVYSLQGTLMLQRKAEPDEQIYVGNLAKGIYLVRVNGMVFKVLKR